MITGTTIRYGLDETTIEKIRAVFTAFPEVNQAILYGSRAKGTYRPGSDIDLTLQGENLSLSVLNQISLRLDDLLLPYTFDVSIFSRIQNPDLVEHIHRVGREFYGKRQEYNMEG